MMKRKVERKRRKKGRNLSPISRGILFQFLYFLREFDVYIVRIEEVSFLRELKRKREANSRDG